MTPQFAYEMDRFLGLIEDKGGSIGTVENRWVARIDNFTWVLGEELNTDKLREAMDNYMMRITAFGGGSSDAGS